MAFNYIRVACGNNFISKDELMKSVRIAKNNKWRHVFPIISNKKRVVFKCKNENCLYELRANLPAKIGLWRITSIKNHRCRMRRNLNSFSINDVSKII